ncbi:hypothetical protein [Microbacterium resistens]|nr:hypothetical protein [Microbacterium resistens]
MTKPKNAAEAIGQAIGMIVVVCAGGLFVAACAWAFVAIMGAIA